MSKSSHDLKKHLTDTRALLFRLQSKEAIYDAMSDQERHELARLRRESSELQRTMLAGALGD